MTIVDLIGIVREGGTLAVLVLMIGAGMRGVYVWRWQYDAVKADRDEWKAMALASTNLAKRAVNVAKGPR